MKTKRKQRAKVPTGTIARERAAHYRVSGDDYPFTVRPLAEDEGGGYLIEFPDLPGCISDGETLEEAITSGMDAKQAWLAVAREENRAIPEPGGQASGKWVQRVPKSLHSRLVERAEHEGVSLNMLVVSLIAEGLGKRRN
jgi:antitoxin HicB